VPRSRSLPVIFTAGMGAGTGIGTDVTVGEDVSDVLREETGAALREVLTSGGIVDALAAENGAEAAGAEASAAKQSRGDASDSMKIAVVMLRCIAEVIRLLLSI